MTNKHIEIVRSASPSLSSMGQASAAMIRDVLEKHYTHVGVTTISTVHDLQAVVAKRPDLVFLGVKNVPYAASFSRPSAKIWLAAYLEAHNLHYAGSRAPAIALDFGKPMAKQVVQAAGHRTPAYFLAREGQYKSSDELPLTFPLFVKPPSAGGGKGVSSDSVVRDFAAFQQKVKAIADSFHSAALVETYLTGREFTVAVLETPNSDKLIVMPIELVADQNEHGDRILSQSIKTADAEKAIAVTDTVLRYKIMELAAQVFKVLGARDYGRIDIRLDAHGTPHFLEANLIPSLVSGYGNFPKACMLNLGLDHEAMILNIVELGLSRTPATLAIVDPKLKTYPSLVTR